MWHFALSIRSSFEDHRAAPPHGVPVDEAVGVEPRVSVPVRARHRNLNEFLSLVGGKSDDPLARWHLYFFHDKLDMSGRGPHGARDGAHSAPFGALSFAMPLAITGQLEISLCGSIRPV